MVWLSLLGLAYQSTSYSVDWCADLVPKTLWVISVCAVTYYYWLYMYKGGGKVKLPERHISGQKHHAPLQVEVYQTQHFQSFRFTDINIALADILMVYVFSCCTLKIYVQCRSVYAAVRPGSCWTVLTYRVFVTVSAVIFTYTVQIFTADAAVLTVFTGIIICPKQQHYSWQKKSIR